MTVPPLALQVSTLLVASMLQLIVAPVPTPLLLTILGVPYVMFDDGKTSVRIVSPVGKVTTAPLLLIVTVQLKAVLIVPVAGLGPMLLALLIDRTLVAYSAVPVHDTELVGHELLLEAVAVSVCAPELADTGVLMQVAILVVSIAPATVSVLEPGVKVVLSANVQEEKVTSGLSLILTLGNGVSPSFATVNL